MDLRQADPEDAGGMVVLLNDIIAIGGTTAHRRAFDRARMLSLYINAPRRLACSIALEDGVVLGFQALEWADPDWTGAGKLPQDWAVIASFVGPAAQGQGVGQALFGETLRVIEGVGIAAIDATIRTENTLGQGYYARLGFEDYRESPQTVSKRYVLSPATD